ncbi:MAG: hypothetical protein K2L64_01050, partial [Ureaplasma sp.]|nr:hypothetical protein [Ureaplasma sp.]
YLSIPANAIDAISYNNNTLIITPISMVKFTSDTISGSTNIINQISVSDLKFYSSTDLIGLENLYNVLNNYITDSSRKFTAKQFADQVTDNNSTIKSLVTSNLYVDENNKIDPSLVSSVTFNETSKQLEVVLNSDYKKYNLTSTNNVTLNGNIMIVSGFTFYDGIEIGETELNSFESNIQNYINENTNQYTQEQFVNQLNLDGFKNLVSTSLSISSSSINTISFENGTLTIAPNAMKKFVSSSTSNLIVEGSIKVNGLKFYTEQSLVNLNLLYDSLKNYILNSTRKYTSDEFANITNTVDNAGIKQIVASKLYVAENQLINESDIISVSFNTTSNQLEITLNSSYKKYNLSGSDNVAWENGKLVVKNLLFYTAISITPEKLNGLQSFVQSYINQASNQYTLSE